ncbi:hypothetical protein BU16DRAFT_544941 [Lophium mytilinum]|uniref:Uncharacterized protein n=1 Tax=Lophium mytilinum TaxID=390894 RepID=A0A6A6Q9L5_9PEZI|nr:hypothetical protein BU16DRAFT_544941 [Lophium mytilinum]
MVSLIKLIALAASVGKALACVHAYGYIDDCPIDVGDCGRYATLTDNGGVVCQGDIGTIDQDGHYTIHCNPGYVWAFTQNLAHSWYGYGSASFQWDQHVDTGSWDCGICTGKNGHCQHCSTRQFDTKIWSGGMYKGLLEVGRRRILGAMETLADEGPLCISSWLDVAAPKIG